MSTPAMSGFLCASRDRREPGGETDHMSEEEQLAALAAARRPGRGTEGPRRPRDYPVASPSGLREVAHGEQVLHDRHSWRLAPGAKPTSRSTVRRFIIPRSGQAMIFVARGGLTRDR